MINSELFRNVELGECEPQVRLLYIGMIVNADDEGRMRAHPKYLRASIFPFDLIADAAIIEMRSVLAAKKIIILYEVEGVEYLQHPKWGKWQILRKDRVKSSDCPSPRGQMATKWQPNDTQVGAEPNPTEVNPTQPNPKTPLALNPEKSKGSNLKDHPWLLGLDLYLADEKLMTKIWTVDKAWMKAYPGIDIGMEIKKAHAWEITNPDRAKKNRIKFFNTWLSRAQDRPRMAQPGGYTNASNGSASIQRDTPIARRAKELAGLRKVGDEGDSGTLFSKFRNHPIPTKSAGDPDAGRSGTDAKPLAGL